MLQVEMEAALQLQAAWRGYLARKQFMSQLEQDISRYEVDAKAEHTAAVRIQACWRGINLRKRQAAATQSAYRGMSARSVVAEAESAMLTLSLIHI